MNEIVTESGLAHCEWWRILKTGMVEQGADTGNQ